MAIRFNQGVAALALLAALGLMLFPPLPGPRGPALALSVAVIGLWASAAVPEYLTALGFLTVAMIFAVAPPSVVFSGFQAPALWLIFGGLVVGVAVRTTGLGVRIARRMAFAFGSSYWGIITGVSLIGTVLGFGMPSSMGRVVLLMPIALSLAEGYGFKPGSRGHAGVIMAAAFGSHVATFSILPANVPNVVLSGAAESLYHINLTYGAYLLLHFPVLGLLKLLLMIPLVVWLCPDTPGPMPQHEQTPMSADEKRLSLVLITALGFWATDSLHHISPAWVSMAAAVLLLLPKIGMVSTEEFNRQINYGSLFYVGGVMGLGALLDKSGLAATMADGVLHWVPLAPRHALSNFFNLAGIATVVSMITTLPGTPAVLTPLAGRIAEVCGLPLLTVLNSQVLGFSNPILVYESPPLVVGMALGGEPVGKAQKLCVLLAVATMLVLWPLDFLWWKLLGEI